MRAVFVIIAATGMMISATQAEERRVGMAGMVYEPAVVEAKLGDTVVFANDDSVAHAVFVPTLGFSTNLGSQDPGARRFSCSARSGCSTSSACSPITCMPASS